MGNPRLAVFNRDDSSYEYLHSLNPKHEVTYGIHNPADVRVIDYTQDPTGLHIQIRDHFGELNLNSSLIGEYNVYNILAAYSAATAGLRINQKTVQAGIAALKAVPGRMERISLGQNFTAIVDFAHTPNALKNALKTCRELTTGKVIAVFGSAGLRDRQKRKLMAEFSLAGADFTILTAEDPRTESLDDILSEMAAAATAIGGMEGINFWRIPDRGEAIRFALGLALDGDVVIACGKGHEQSMCFGETEHYWDDRVAMQAYLSKMLGIDGPEIPLLPTSG
jgi:UDP-N-acetylmuramoyl-L-alanyl-D-glutamate--2,6-diaminopimelate ligase